MDVSARIRDIIDDRDMTQKELALRLDIRYTTLNNYLKKYNRVPLIEGSSSMSSTEFMIPKESCVT